MKRSHVKRVWMVGLMLALAVGAEPAAAGVPNADPYLWSSMTFVRVLGPALGLAGRDLNGMALNGALLDGRHVVSVSFDGATRGGHELSSVSLKRSRFVGIGGLYSSHGQPGGEVRFRAELDDGVTIELRIESAEPHPDPGHQDVFLYEVSYSTAEGWQPLCGYDGQGLPLRAIPLAGRWSYEEGTPGGGSHFDEPDVFTFACEDRVLAKCVLAGYKPWQKVLACGEGQGCQLTTLAAHHQACSRAMRADYCGDGVSHTQDGMEINFFDDLGVRVDELGWSVEAEWYPGGARCAVAERLDSAAPWCMQSLYDPDCGQLSNLGSQSLLITEYEAP